MTDLAALAVFHAVTVLLEKCTDKDLQVFDVFSEYISLLVGLPELSVVMPEILSALRLSTKRDHLKFLEIVNFGKTQAKIRESIRETLRNLHNRDDLTALLELRDIEDELKTLDKVFSEQVTVIDQMLSAYKKIDQYNEQQLSSRVSPEEYRRLRDSVLHLNSISWLHNARARVEKYQSQTENMRNSCISVQESVGS